MTSDLDVVQPATLDAAILKQVVSGNLSGLTDQQQVDYYLSVCQSVGLNPATRPFQFLTTRDGRVILYATKDCSDQLRRRDRISTDITSRETTSDQMHVVTARASTPDGRHEESIGAVAVATLKGEALADALMKAETKAKRRATLSLCGLGFLDETETDWATAAGPIPAGVLEETGELVDDIVRAQLVRNIEGLPPDDKDRLARLWKQEQIPNVRSPHLTTSHAHRIAALIGQISGPTGLSLNSEQPVGSEQPEVDDPKAPSPA
jgi:hypothetical protein